MISCCRHGRYLEGAQPALINAPRRHRQELGNINAYRNFITFLFVLLGTGLSPDHGTDSRQQSAVFGSSLAISVLSSSSTEQIPDFSRESNGLTTWSLSSPL
jgi:hypothetical protein